LSTTLPLSRLFTWLERALSYSCYLYLPLLHYFLRLFFHAPAATEIYTLSLHDALPISHDDVTGLDQVGAGRGGVQADVDGFDAADRKSTRLNSSHVSISYAVFCLKKKIYAAKSAIYINTGCITARTSIVY